MTPPWRSCPVQATSISETLDHGHRNDDDPENVISPWQRHRIICICIDMYIYKCMYVYIYSQYMYVCCISHLLIFCKSIADLLLIYIIIAISMCPQDFFFQGLPALNATFSRPSSLGFTCWRQRFPQELLGQSVRSLTLQ